MASAAENNDMCEEEEESTVNNGETTLKEGLKKSSSDSKIKKLRRKISQGLRLSFIKDENGRQGVSLEQNSGNTEADVFDDCSQCSPTNNLAVRPVVRRTVSDSIGSRLRKISFEIGNGRRHSDEFTPEEFKNLPQSSTSEDKRSRWFTRKGLQSAVDSKRRQLQKDAKNLEIAHGKVHPITPQSAANLETATVKYEITLKELADLYAQDRWGDYSEEALLTKEFSSLKIASEPPYRATDDQENYEETRSQASVPSRRTSSSRSSKASSAARREALAEAAAAKQKAEFERVMAEKENLRRQQEAEEEKRREQQRAQHDRDMAILAANKAEAVARARLKAIEESIREDQEEDYKSTREEGMGSHSAE
ncbi:hypothetical protein ACROYT_G035537 [Oculina patagonica]